MQAWGMSEYKIKPAIHSYLFILLSPLFYKVRE